MSENIIDYEILGDTIKYKCNISNSNIVFQKNKDTMKLTYAEFNWDIPKLVLHLINYSVNDIMTRYKDVVHFNYCINKEDYKGLDKSDWVIKKEYDNYYELQCPIKESMYNVIKGFMAS